jgi:GNAT superfamily N-acetyltransferase
MTPTGIVVACGLQFMVFRISLIPTSQGADKPVARKTARMPIEVRRADSSDVDLVAAILIEASHWLDSRGMGMWRANELTPDRIAKDVGDGLFFLAADQSQAVGTVKFQLSDVEFWPDLTSPDSTFVHRLAVVRRAAGQGVSTALLAWAVHRTRKLGRRFLRLDCEASRPRLRAIYEGFGFHHHSDRQVGPYFVARYELDVRRFNDPIVPTAI